jgi:hypothetical protein
MWVDYSYVLRWTSHVRALGVILLLGVAASSSALASLQTQCGMGRGKAPCFRKVVMTHRVQNLCRSQEIMKLNALKLARLFKLQVVRYSPLKPKPA